MGFLFRLTIHARTQFEVKKHRSI